ncbi:MAG: YjbQ family protein [Bradymonadales bacterium]|nr:YjbQ family protein [Bradymonadales bacterium]
MIVHHTTYSTDLKAPFDAADLSQAVDQAIRESKIRQGIITLFAEGSTAALTTIEFESGCLADLKKALDRIAPIDADYAHNARWGDGNGFSHLRAALLGPSLSAPVVDARAAFSTWQQPILINLDSRPRRRTVRLTVIGVTD